MQSVKKDNLSLLFTRKVSLSDWVDLGIISREILIYNMYLNKKYFKNIYFYTYGTDDYNLSIKLKKKGIMHNNIHVIPKRKFFNFNINSLIYSILMVFLYKKQLANSLIKTNQIDVGFSSILLKLFVSKRVILRGGYLKSSLLKNTFNVNSKYSYLKVLKFIKYIIIKYYEKISIKIIRKVILSNYEDRRYLINELKIQSQIIFVIPTFIDVKNFKSKVKISKRLNKFLYVGRLSEEKNLFEVIKCICDSGFRLNIIGKGNLEIELKEFVIEKKYDVEFISNIPNENLPDTLNKYKYFILGSLSEGLPKALLEAMSCGMICFVNDIPAIKKIIRNFESGIILKSVDKINLELAISSLSPNKENYISTKSIKFINDHHSVNNYISEEINLIFNL